MSRRSTAISDLRRAVDRLPRATREAMLDGVRSAPIIVGAYTDGQGGVCPMLAAHRNGGRHSLLAFARSWDAFTIAPRKGSRRATPREIAVLERHLVASLAADGGDPPVTNLSKAIAEHRSLAAGRSAREAERAVRRAARLEAVRPDAETERLVREGTAPEVVAVPDPVAAPRPRRRLRDAMPHWMRPLETIEDYERALAEVDRQQVRLGLVGDTAGPGLGARRPEHEVAGR